MQLTVRDASRLLQTTEKQIYAWVDEGDIPFETVNEQPRFNRTELLEWATSRRLRVTSDIFEPGELGGPPMQSLSGALATGGVHRVDGVDRDAVLRQVVAAMPIRDPADRDLLLEILLARETMGSTAIGDGIAIPHVRAPAVIHGAPTSVTLCYLAHPVDFHAPDGLPVHTLFSIISPNVPGHLELLAKLAAALHEPPFRAAVARRAGLEEILAEARAVSARRAARRGSSR